MGNPVRCRRWTVQMLFDGLGLVPVSLIWKGGHSMKGFSHSRHTALSDVDRTVRWREYRELPELQSGQYVSVMHKLDVDSSKLADRMCAVQLPSQECVILVLPEYLHDDAVLALRIAMDQAGFMLAPRPVVTVPASVLSAVARKGRIEQRVSTTQLRPKPGAASGHILFSLLDDLLGWAVQHDASDVHLGVYRGHLFADVAFSVRGRLVRPEMFLRLPVEVVHEMLSVAWMRVQGGNGAVFEPQREQQGRLERIVLNSRISVRWASIVSHKGPCITLRLLQRERSAATADLRNLGYTEQQLQCLYRARLSTGGAVLMAGSVGSGKSTTLAALIRSLPADRKVITLEDPVEFDLPNAIQCGITAFGDGDTDRERFDIKLQALKRSAANDVLIGEIRDQGSARALTDLLVAGTNVYSTVHAGSALQIIPRLCSPTLGVAPDLLAVPGVLKLLVFQTLLNALCVDCCMDHSRWLKEGAPTCALGVSLTESEAQKWLEDVERILQLDRAQLRFRHLPGCSSCCPAHAVSGHALEKTHAQDGHNDLLAADGRHLSAGYSGNLMAAEFVEPMRIRQFGAWIQGLARTAYRLTEATGSSLDWIDQQERAADTARQYVSQGRLDPREYMLRFGGA